MSQIVTTKLGRFRRVSLGDKKTAWLWECPQCERWGGLSDAQLAGTVSVACDCGYHETHNYGAELVATMQARILAGEPPIDPELAPSTPSEEPAVDPNWLPRTL